jgi:RNA polymerase sigma-70 factor (ECF subfamily)
MTRISAALLSRLYDRSEAAQWNVPCDQFARALDASVAHAFAGRQPTGPDVDRYVESLHLADLALACACASGIDAAWEHFMREHRPGLYRSANAIDPSGGARDLADAMYADLFGLKERDGERQSLFRYFHGRSSLGTWLRAVLAQRHIDGVRAGRRTDPLPDDDVATLGSLLPGHEPPDPDRARHVAAIQPALASAIAGLASRDRLRLGCYYAQDLTLAAIGRLLGEHEATVSRHLARTRHDIRNAVDRHLREQGFDENAIAECFRSVGADAGDLDLGELIGPSRADDRRSASSRKNLVEDRSR